MFHLRLLLANRISNSVINCNLFVVYKYDFNQAHRAQLNDKCSLDVFCRNYYFRQNWKLYWPQVSISRFLAVIFSLSLSMLLKGTRTIKNLVRYLFKVQPDMIEWHEMAISKQYLQFLWCQAMVTLPLQKAPKQQIRLNYYRY